MIESVLGIIATEMQNIEVPYEYMRWSSPVQDHYWIGECTEVSTDTEDGYNEFTMMLTGTAKGSWLELEQQKAKIKDHFPQIGGFRKATEKGAVVIFYDNSFPIDTGEADLKRIQINLNVKTWKGE
jgi:hypothetical protein